MALRHTRYTQHEQLSRMLGFFCGWCGFFTALFAIQLLFVLVYHQLPTLVLLIVGSFAVLALLPVATAHGPMLAAGLVTSVLAFAVGGLHCYYSYALPLRTLHEGHTYNGVFPQQPAIAFSDAAKLDFAPGTSVDVSKALGMKSVEAGVHTFCVAPVLDSQSSGRVEFWATGIDCCKNIGNFVCDDVGDADVASGFVLSDRPGYDPLFGSFLGQYLAPPLMRRDILLKAVAKAEAVHSVVSSRSPVLLRWKRGSREKLVEEARSRLSWALVVAAACAAVVALLLILGLRMLLSLRDQRRQYEVRVAKLAGLPEDTPAEVALFVNVNVLASGASFSTSDILWLALLVPYIVFIVAVVLWTWLRCWRHGDLVASLFAGFVVSTAAALLTAPGKRVYGFLVLLAAVVGGLVGNSNYTRNTFHYCSVLNHRTYGNVPPDAAAAEYSDAGQIRFEDGAKVDETRSLGLRRRGVTYCAAPVVAEGGSGSAAASVASAALGVPPRHDFWAVGTDCCDARGGFRCGGGGDQWRMSALVLRDAGAGDELHRSLARAARAAAETYGLPLPRAPMLLHWAGDAEAERAEWVGRAMGVCLLSAAVALVALSFVAALNLCCARTVRRLEMKRAKRHQRDTEAG